MTVSHGADSASVDGWGKMRSKDLLHRILALLVLCFAFLSVLGCQRETEQDKIKKVIMDIQKAAEEKDVKKILTGLSKNYKDPLGNDYDSIKGLLFGYFFRHQAIHVYITNLEVTVQDSAATAVFQAVLSGGNKSESVADLLPEALGMYAFEVSLKNEDGVWKVSFAKWERVGAGEGGGGQENFPALGNAFHAPNNALKSRLFYAIIAFRNDHSAHLRQ